MNFLVTPSFWAWIICFTSILTLIFWVITRKKNNIAWLPIIQITNLTKTYFPKLKFSPPPTIPFIAFLISLIALIFLALEPSNLISKKKSRKKLKTHVFIDMSPSVSATTSIEEFTSTIGTLLYSLQENHEVSISTSHSSSIEPLKNVIDIKNFILQQGFHSEGIYLANALKKHSNHLAKIDELIIISDQDQHSWLNFNWKYFQKNTQVSHVDTGNIPTSASNFFFLNAKYLALQSKSTMDWSVTLARRGRLQKAGGTLEVSYQNKLIKAIPWSMNQAQNQTTIHIDWPKSKIDKLNQSSSNYLKWKIRPQKKDLIASDNEFFTRLKGAGHPVLIVADPMGENSLEDPAYQLIMALQSIDYDPYRIDWFEKKAMLDYKNYPLWIIFIKEHHSNNFDNYCPAQLAKVSAAIQYNEITKSNPQSIWLVPQYNVKNFHTICSCHKKLIEKFTQTSKTYKCKDSTGIKSFNQLMTSLGSKQIGGSLGESQEAIAWKTKITNRDKSIITFTVPLRPSKHLQISHAKFPILVKELFDHLDNIKQAPLRKNNPWNRIDDITTVLQWDHHSKQDYRMKYNVPIGESLLQQVLTEHLPPTWSNETKKIAQFTHINHHKKNPQPWIFLIYTLLILSFILEIIFYRKKRLSKMENLKKHIIILFLAVITKDTLHAVIHLNYLSNKKQITDISVLSKEVSFRTSIHLNDQMHEINTFDQNKLTDPWLWTDSTKLIINKQGMIKEKISRWIKRGGFMIIENYENYEQIKNMTLQEFHDPYKKSQWISIPKDHEIMRSFYLLKDLHPCERKLWHGFHFDNRLAIIVIPFQLINAITDPQQKAKTCLASIRQEQLIRMFTNILLVALTTDYKKDQVHTKEILKRLH